MLAAGGVQFVVGCVLEGEQSIVGTWYGQEDLIELALGRPLMAAMGVPDDEDHGQGQGGYHGLEDRFPSSRNPAAMRTGPPWTPADERPGQPAGGRRLSHGTRQSLSVLAELAG